MNKARRDNWRAFLLRGMACKKQCRPHEGNRQSTIKIKHNLGLRLKGPISFVILKNKR